jgi:hypothetical protein
MPRERLTQEALVAGGTFDAGNWRHRRALDESGPLHDPELERARKNAQDLRGAFGARIRAAEPLRAFAWLITDRWHP